MRARALARLPAQRHTVALITGSLIVDDDLFVRYKRQDLLIFREAARECRRKKKEYIKCLENRVAVLENQNKALIEELKKLKELYAGNGAKSV